MNIIFMIFVSSFLILLSNYTHELCTSLYPRPPQARKRVGDSSGKVLCFYFSIVPAVPRKYLGFVLYRQIWQCNENITDCRGKGLWCSRSEGLLAGIWPSAGQRSKSPLFPGAGGQWLQMTGALQWVELL